MPTIHKIFGGPGTGKTTRLIDLVFDEIKRGVKPAQIAYISHTKAAADEAWNRVCERGNFPKTRPQWFCTIHAAARRKIGWPRQKIWGWREMNVLREETGLKFRVGAEFDDRSEAMVGDPILQVLNFANARMITLDEAMEQFRRFEIVTPDSVAQMQDTIKSIKERNDVRDFDDLLLMYHERPDPLNCKVMFIDEAQDLSVLQWRIVEQMWASCDRVYICGDDDQSIYGFMGADPDGFLDHACDSEEVLPISWRVPKNIGAYAERIIKQVTKRKQKNLKWRDEDGIIERLWADKDTLPLQAGVSTKVLVRHQMQARSIYRALRRDGMSVSCNGESYLTGDEAKAVVVFEKLKAGEQIGWTEGIAMMKAVPGREASVEKMKEARALTPLRSLTKDDFALKWQASYSANFGHTVLEQELFDCLTLYTSKVGTETLMAEPTVQVMTMHAAKGLEADHTIVMTDCYPAVWVDQDGDYADIERKVAYVAATRARKRLTLVEPAGDQYCRALVETTI